MHEHTDTNKNIITTNLRTTIVNKQKVLPNNKTIINLREIIIPSCSGVFLQAYTILPGIDEYPELVRLP